MWDLQSSQATKLILSEILFPVLSQNFLGTSNVVQLCSICITILKVEASIKYRKVDLREHPQVNTVDWRK